jgi:transglutaminase-like putative cysteine protease
MASAAVYSTLTYDVVAPSRIAFQVAAAVAPRDEALAVTVDGAPVEPLALAGGHTHLVEAPTGRLVVTYSAGAFPLPPSPPAPTDLDRIVALSPSRYCPADRLAGYAARRFGGLADGAATVRVVAAHVHDRLSYQGGVSGPTTDAVDTLLTGAGVCRDYAHLVAALCRAVGVPARVAAVYAPGLDPMDFHLVVETALDDGWYVWDATRLAPRQTLIRVATGRDAADVAFATMLSGQVEARGMEITAVADGDLPPDDHESLVALG